jgi:hypothetical protein
VNFYSRGRGATIIGVEFQHGSLVLTDRLVGGLTVSDR